MNPATMQQQDSSIMRPIIFTLIVHGTILFTIHTLYLIYVYRAVQCTVQCAYRKNYLCTYDLYGPCVMFLMRADTLRGQVGGGWALEMESFWAL
jgi:hypothetical protein